MSAPAISQHLKVLKQAQVVLVEVQAQQRIYTINPDGIGDVEQRVNEVKQCWDQRLDALKLLLQEEGTKSNTNASNNSTSIPHRRGKTMLSKQPEFNTIRVFNAPLDLVWRAWTEPNLSGRWFGPKGFSSRVKNFDLRAGGMLHSCLISQDGHEMWAKFVYREVTPKSRLIWEHSFSDSKSNLTRHPLRPEWPPKLLTTIALTDLGDKTQLHLHWTPLDARDTECQVFLAGMDGMHQGWGDTSEQLDAFLTEAQA